MEELLSYLADPDKASKGEDPPLCVAVRNSRRDNIARTLLSFRANVSLRSISSNSPVADGRGGAGFTPLELAQGDPQLVEMLATYSRRCCEAFPCVNASAEQRDI